MHTAYSNANEVVMNVDDWAGQQVLVVGASKGIGAALVAALLDRGAAQVWAASRSGACVDDPRVTSLTLDATDEASLTAVVTRIRDRTDRLDAVHHTPGLLQNDQLRPERRMQEVTLDALQTSFAVNAFAPILTAKHLMPLLWHGERAIFALLSARVGSIGDNGRGSCTSRQGRAEPADSHGGHRSGAQVQITDLLHAAPGHRRYGAVQALPGGGKTRKAVHP